jgi:hypothetical protein
MDQGLLFEQALKRPRNYNKLTSSLQWQVDKDLGILDWDGSCPHQKGYPCAECIKKYDKDH